MNPYLEQMILSASPVELIRLLYRRAIGAAREAREHLRAGRVAERCAAVNIVYAVLTELTSSLRADAAPELAAQLKGLYGHMQGRLIEANLNQLDAPLVEVVGLLTTLAEAWNALPEPMTAEAAEAAARGTRRDAGSGASVGTDGVYRVAVSA